MATLLEKCLFLTSILLHSRKRMVETGKNCTIEQTCNEQTECNRDRVRAARGTEICAEHAEVSRETYPNVNEYP